MFVACVSEENINFASPKHSKIIISLQRTLLLAQKCFCQKTFSSSCLLLLFFGAWSFSGLSILWQNVMFVWDFSSFWTFWTFVLLHLIFNLISRQTRKTHT